MGIREDLGLKIGKPVLRLRPMNREVLFGNAMSVKAIRPMNFKIEPRIVMELDVTSGQTVPVSEGSGGGSQGGYGFEGSEDD